MDNDTGSSFPNYKSSAFTCCGSSPTSRFFPFILLSPSQCSIISAEPCFMVVLLPLAWHGVNGMLLFSRECPVGLHPHSVWPLPETYSRTIRTYISKRVINSCDSRAEKCMVIYVGRIWTSGLNFHASATHLSNHLRCIFFSSFMSGSPVRTRVRAAQYGWPTQ